MRDLAQDLEEAGDDKALRRFIRSRRRDAGLGPDDASAWLAHAYNDRHPDELLVGIGRSPADVIITAEIYADANYAARRLGIGAWIMEVLGAEDGIDRLRVRCSEDNAYYQEDPSA